jgi:eukaryotic-like serine/threonine-protein kinase
MESTPDRRLGRYLLKDYIGGGAMADVYRAFDPYLQREVAIKVMHRHLLHRKGFKERFNQEFRTTVRLHDVGIIQVFDSGEANGELFIVMPFVSGGSLEKKLKDLKAKGVLMPLNEAVGLVRQVSFSLHYAHQHGMFHRDIKPSNILLDQEPCEGLPYRPVLSDLGLAKLAEGELETQTGISMGTPMYMSPEQAQGKDVDARSDIYSLGALLFHLCTGQPPFPAKTFNQGLHYHIHEPPPSPRSINPHLSVELNEGILRALEKDPDRRFPNAAQFAQMLGRVLDKDTGVAVDDRPEVVGTTVDGRPAVHTSSERNGTTQLQPTQGEQGDTSMLSSLTTAIPATGEDHILVIRRGKQSQRVPIRTQTINVGRSPRDNQIVLSDESVTRLHLSIVRDGNVYKVIDRGSTNGTYMGGVRLLKGVAHEWTPDMPLKVGKAYLKLILGRAIGQDTTTGITIRPTTVTTKGGLMVTGTTVLAAGGENRLGFKLDQEQQFVDAGNVVTVVTTIQNQSTQVHHYRISVDGVPPNWVKDVPVQPLKCMPGESQRVTLSILPPRSPDTSAGTYNVVVVATCLEDSIQGQHQRLALTVNPYRQFTSLMNPQRFRSGRPSWVRVFNQGNSPETYFMFWKDQTNELDFNPERIAIQLREGESMDVEFRGSTRQIYWFGPEKSHRFNAFIASVNQQSAAPQTLPGEILTTALIPAWVPPLLIVLFLIFCTTFGILYRIVYLPPVHGTQTARANITLVNIVGITATYENSDPDHDSLTNKQEAILGTDPNNSDTDGDGLTDGQEVNIYGTDPKKRDTDNDSIPDGVEVNNGTNPNNPDTDGDGLLDNVDPDPGHLPTPTKTLTLTPTLTLTSTTTFTASSTFTPSQTMTPTNTNSPTATLTPFQLPSSTFTPSITPFPTPTP